MHKKTQRENRRPLWLLLPLFFMLSLGFVAATPHVAHAEEYDWKKDPCPDVAEGAEPDGTLLKDMRLASDAKNVSDQIKTDSLFRQQPIRDKLKCIRTLITVWNAIQAILAGDLLSVVGTIILGFIGYVINMIVNAVCNALRTTINNLLAMVCIPIPKLPMLSLPSLASQSCAIGSGMSLLQLLQTPPGRLLNLPGNTPQNYRTGRAIYDYVRKEWIQE